MVKHGFLSIEWRIDGGETQRVNLKAGPAMEDNQKHDPKYTEGALTWVEALPKFDARLDECVVKGMRLRIEGDVSGINYSLALAQRKNIFDRKWTAMETVHP
jgi:hypothetical protein